MADANEQSPGLDESTDYEWVAMEYIDAMDADDSEAIQALWLRAEVDPELERIFLELDEGLLLEGGPKPPWDQGRDRRLELLGRHFPSGATSDPSPAGLTVGDVAARIAGDRSVLVRLTAADRNANQSLLTNRKRLPDHLPGRILNELAESLSVSAGQAYWREFQQAAGLMRLADAADASMRAAARPVNWRPRG